MAVLRRSVYILLVCGVLTSPALSDTSLHVMVNLLDYVGRDYRYAVQNGVVQDTFEYGEMREFSHRLFLLWDSLRGQVPAPVFQTVRQQLQHLQQLIAQKAEHDSIAALTGRIRQQLFHHNLVQIAPSHWPSLRKGQQVYQQYCQSCHGMRGDGRGAAAAGLTPPPANLRDTLFQWLSSPLSVYHTTRLGIEGTAMRGFAELSEEELWDVAFFVKALPHQHRSVMLPAQLQDSLLLQLPWVSRSTDRELVAWIQRTFPTVSESPEVLLAAIRTFEPEQTPLVYVEFAQKALDTVAQQVRSGAYAAAFQETLQLYLQFIEPLEQFLQIRNPALGARLERNMLALRSVLEKQNREEALALIQTLQRQLQQAKQELGDQIFSFGFTFWMALAIILREGIEALLIIIVILSVLRRLAAEHLRHVVHAGWIGALLAGAALWLFADMLLRMGVQSRELFEGVGALVAVAILLYVGFWLHQSSTAAGWQRFVQQKLPALVSQRNAIGLFVLAFIAVFREAAETVVFLSALNIESQPTTGSGILAGLGAAAVALALIAWGLQRLSQNIPFKQLFRLSSVTMVILAVVLVGKGIHALQEAGYVSVYPLPFHFDLPLLGVFATAETLLAQIGVVALTLLLWQIAERRQAVSPS